MLTWWVIGIVAIIYAGYAIYFYFFVKKRNVNMLNKQAPGKNLDSAKEFHNELNMVADLAVKNIEEKITHLEHLIEGAQKKSKQLEHLMEDTQKKSERLEHLLEDTQKKSERLEHLLEDTQKKSERLENLLEDSRKKSERLEHLLEDSRKKSEQVDVKIKFASNIIKEIKNLTDRQQLSFFTEKLDAEKEIPAEIPQIKNQDSNVDIVDIFINPGSLNEESSKNQEAVNNDKHRVVLQMSKEGYSVMDIARITGMGKGEVMLLRQLYNEKQDVREE